MSTLPRFASGKSCRSLIELQGCNYRSYSQPRTYRRLSVERPLTGVHRRRDLATVGALTCENALT